MFLKNTGYHLLPYNWKASFTSRQAAATRRTRYQTCSHYDGCETWHCLSSRERGRGFNDPCLPTCSKAVPLREAALISVCVYSSINIYPSPRPMHDVDLPAMLLSAIPPTQRTSSSEVTDPPCHVDQFICNVGGGTLDASTANGAVSAGRAARGV